MSGRTSLGRWLCMAGIVGLGCKATDGDPDVTGSTGDVTSVTSVGTGADTTTTSAESSGNDSGSGSGGDTWEPPVECQGWPAIEALSFLDPAIADRLTTLPLVGCYEITCPSDLFLGQCATASLVGASWATLPDGLYAQIGFADPDTAYPYMYTVGIGGGAAHDAAPIPLDMPGGGQPTGTHGYLGLAAMCGGAAFADTVACECATAGTYRVAVYYARKLLEAGSCSTMQPDGSACSFHFNCADGNCPTGVCGGGGGGTCGDGTCSTGEGVDACPQDCTSTDACGDCLDACAGLPDGCCTGCGCACEDECQGCW